MQENEELSHMEEYDKLKGNHNSYFLPQHAVIKKTSTATRVRVVLTDLQNPLMGSASMTPW